MDMFSHCSLVNAARVSCHASWCVFLNSENVHWTLSLTGFGSHVRLDSSSKTSGIHSGTPYGADKTHALKPSTHPCLLALESSSGPSTPPAAASSPRPTRDRFRGGNSLDAFKQRARMELAVVADTPLRKPISVSRAIVRTSIWTSHSAANVSSRKLAISCVDSVNEWRYAKAWQNLSAAARACHWCPSLMPSNVPATTSARCARGNTRYLM